MRHTFVNRCTRLKLSIIADWLGNWPDIQPGSGVPVLDDLCIRCWYLKWFIYCLVLFLQAYCIYFQCLRRYYVSVRLLVRKIISSALTAQKVLMSCLMLDGYDFLCARTTGFDSRQFLQVLLVLDSVKNCCRLWLNSYRFWKSTWYVLQILSCHNKSFKVYIVALVISSVTIPFCFWLVTCYQMT